LVCAFDGWNDAGDAATTALISIVDSLGGEQFAAIDLEPFVDLRETRPIIRLVDGETRELEWPETTFFAVRAPGAQRDLVIARGPEPALNWRAYTQELLDLCESLGCSMLVTLGAFLADLPHTRPVPIAGSSTDPALSADLGLMPSNYEGPTGITAAIHFACAQAGIPSVSMWAAVPHYIAAMPNPKAALALVRRLEMLTGVIVDARELEADSLAHERQVEQAVGHDEELRGFVEQLEEAAEEESAEAEEEIPSADAIAHELQRFLRQRDADGD
jgi:predicted ATP-grasp superfamily ATP-dependent carboligase